MTQDILEKKLAKFSYSIFWDRIILLSNGAIKRSIEYCEWLNQYYNWLRYDLFAGSAK